ncbi:MAG: hypothetical protein N2508_02130, partial [Anaerolineae bacterium]|nr:hypothetical protein [Anaerolineae bacterium]
MKHAWLALAALSLLLAPHQINLLPRTEHPLVLEWTTPPVTVHRLGDGLVAVDVVGYEKTTIPGQPQLPFTSTLIAIPPGVSPELRLLAIEESYIPLPGRVVAAPQPSGILYDGEGRPIGGDFTPATETKPPPSTHITLEEIGIVRGVRLARISFYPAVPQGARLRVIRHIKVALAIPGSPQSPQVTDPLVERVREAVRNPWHIVPSPVKQTG